MQKLKDPEKYPLDQKPDCINLGVPRNGPNTPHPALQMAFPYGVYPQPVPQWFSQPPPPQPPMPTPVEDDDIAYPKISDWLDHCDNHPCRSGSNFGSLKPKFCEHWYIYLDQLSKKRITVSELAELLSIEKGRADMISHFAEQDIALLKARKFTLKLPDWLTNNSDHGWGWDN
jgi:hypothetical protein